jgi:hypothetical protein
MRARTILSRLGPAAVPRESFRQPRQEIQLRHLQPLRSQTSGSRKLITERADGVESVPGIFTVQYISTRLSPSLLAARRGLSPATRETSFSAFSLPIRIYRRDARAIPLVPRYSMFPSVNELPSDPMDTDELQFIEMSDRFFIRWRGYSAEREQDASARLR